MAVYYGPQKWTAGTFSHSPYYQSTAFGGGDAPDANYPELASCEHVKTTAGGGPAGENTVDDFNGLDYTSAGIAILAFGSLTSGQFDMRGPVVFEFDCTPKSSKWTVENVGFAELAIMVNAGSDPAGNPGGLLSGDRFLQLEWFRDGGQTGAQFTWNLIWWGINGSNSFVNPNNHGATGVVDDASHHFKIIYTPATIVGDLDSVTQDGRIQVLMDSVSIYDLTGIGCVPNRVAPVGTGQTFGYYARGFWHGYSDLAGPVTNDYIYTGTGVTVAPLPIPVPPAPGTCDPQAQVSNGGKGHSGCNFGGVGWETLYPTQSYGAVPQHADPVDGETLTDKAQLDIWVELDVISYPSLTLTTYRRAVVEVSPPDLSTYYGGRKPSGLLAVGELEHGLGNEQGGFEAASADIDWSDTIDRLFRTLLATQDLDGNEVRVYAASPAARAALSAPRLLFRGVVQRSALNAPLTASLTVVDVLFADGGPFGPDRQWPPLIPKFPALSAMPADTLTAPLSPLYGEKSDYHAKDPVTGAFISKGVVPAKLLGQGTVGAVGDTPFGVYEQDLTIAAPIIDSETNLKVPAAETGFKATTYTYFAALRLSDNKIGAFATSTLDPAGVTEANGIYVFVHARFLVAGTPDPAYNYIAWVSTSPAFHPLTNPNVGVIGIAIHDGITNDFYYRGVSGADSGADFSLLVKPGSGVPDNQWDVYLLQWGAAYRAYQLFGSNLGNGVVDAKHDRVELDIDALNGGSILFPWASDGSIASAWPYANTYVDMVDEHGTTYRLTVFYARGPISDDHKNGVVNFTVNMIGIEAAGDGTGLPIMEVHVAEQHCIENFWLNYYTSGAWATAGTAPKWADGTFKVRSSQFTSRQDYTAQSFGGAGLLVNWYPDKSQGILEHVAEWNFSTETKLGVNGHGQITLGFLDDRNSPATWPRIQHIRDIFGPVTTTFGDNRENKVSGDCDWDPDASKFRSALLAYQSAVGYAKNKNRWKSGNVLHSSILGYADQLAWVLQKRLDRLALGEVNVTIQGPTGWLDTDVDAPGILLTTHEGRGASGYVATPMWLRRRKWSFATRLTTYSLVDITDIPLGNLFINITGPGGP